MNLDIHVIREKSLTVLVTSLLVLFVVMLPRYTDTAKTWYVLLILTALGYLIFNFKQLKDTTLLERAFFAAIVANFVWIAFTFYINGEPDRGASFVWGRHFYLLFLIPLFFLFRKIDIPDKVIVPALLLSVLVSFTDILVDIAQGIDHRWQGMNMNAFGPVQLCLSGILFFYFLKKSEKPARWLILIGFTLGLATIVFSKSRNTWMTFIVLCIFFVFYLARSQSFWRKSSIALGILLLLSSSYFLPIVKDRVDYAVEDIASYFIDDHDQEDFRLSSIGERFELWKTGWKIFLDNPLLGVGVGGFDNAARTNADRYQFSSILRNKYDHNKYLHNQYIAALATRGLPGLIFFLMVIGMPIYIAISYKSSARTNGTTALSIILICLIYIIGSFAEDHFEGKSATMFTSVLLALLLARISPGKPGKDSVTNT